MKTRCPDAVNTYSNVLKQRRLNRRSDFNVRNQNELPKPLTPTTSGEYPQKMQIANEREQSEAKETHQEKKANEDTGKQTQAVTKEKRKVQPA